MPTAIATLVVFQLPDALRELEIVTEQTLDQTALTHAR